jgi:hypothetical protein
MKTFYSILILGLMFCVYLNCEVENNTIPDDSEFSMEFSDGTIINEKDIAFYDITTSILFLNKKLNLIIGKGEPPDGCIEFSVFVDRDIIYQGIIYPDFLYNFVPPANIWISSITYPTFESDILPIKGPRVKINDYRIMMSLGESHLLHHGITCSVNSLKKHPDNDSTLIATITINNLDDINYYIPDPVKTGSKRFHYLGSGFEITNIETQNKYWPISGYDFSLDDVTINDLSMVESHNHITFSYLYIYKSSIPRGLYETFLMYGNLPFINKLPLTQGKNRVWVGLVYSKVDTIKVY